MNSAEDRWRPGLRLLVGPRKDLFCPPGKPQVEIRWKWRTHVGLDRPIGAVICELEGEDIRISGAGESPYFWRSAKKAFAEAWERWIFLRADADGIVGSSNGFAAGATIPDAKLAARNELIERQIVLSAWANRCGFLRQECTDFFVKWLLAPAIRRGWAMDFFRIEAGGLTVFALLARHPRLGAIFDSSFFVSKAVTERKLALSILRALSIHEQVVPITEDEMPERAAPIDHAAFYRNPEHLRAFEFLDRDQGPFDVEMDTMGIEYSTLCEPGRFPAVVRAFHPKWVHLCWGKSSLMGDNPFPHPLA